MQNVMIYIELLINKLIKGDNYDGWVRKYIENDFYTKNKEEGENKIFSR
ncbi:hypothetical protein [Clostridium sp.]|nr:hypothetical protein [Clostridium sp.]